MDPRKTRLSISPAGEAGGTLLLSDPSRGVTGGLRGGGGGGGGIGD